MNPMQSALKDSAGTFDHLALALNYLAETADDQGLRLLLIQLSNQASAAQEELNALLASEVT